MKISALELFSLLNIKYNENFENLVSGIAKELTGIGFEVESVTFEAQMYSNFVVGFVEECTKHTESTKLSICKVNTGKEVLQVLCGAPNVRKGLNVVLAIQGAVVPKNGFVIKKTKLAGYESQGMICSASEMCAGEDGGTIIELPGNAPLGMNYAQYINKNDAILDISITPNRGDALSYYGIARELFTKNIGTLPQKTQSQHWQNTFECNIANGVVKSVFFGKFSSPQKVADVSSILLKCECPVTKFPIVNFLNYITEKYGQPMHLYDADKIKGNISIRPSKEGEKLVTISGEEITLQSGDIVVCDEEKILSLAGIIGDARSAISQQTTTFIVESCSFMRDLIFQTIRRYNLHTSASFRFERYVDSGTQLLNPQALYAQHFAAGIGVNFTKIFALNNTDILPQIHFTKGDIKNILGFEIQSERIVEILQNLGFVCIVKDGEISVTVPSWRREDVLQVYDIAEEILRFTGIELCPKVYLTGKYAQNLNVIAKVKAFLAQEYDEIISLPFASQEDVELFDSAQNACLLANPINTDEPHLRLNLLPALLHNVARTECNFRDGSSIFEVSKVFYENGNELQEHQEICFVRHGFTPVQNPLFNKREYNIFDIKETCIAILREVFLVNVESLTYSQTSHSVLHPHQAFEIMLGKVVIAKIAQVHPLTLEKYKIKNRVFFGNIIVPNIPVKAAKSTLKPEYKAFTLPSVKRELSVLVKNEIQCGDILKSIQKIANKRFNATVYEVFVNSQMVESSEKSLLIGVEIFQDNTLTGEEIETQVTEIINTLKLNFNAQLRG